MGITFIDKIIKTTLVVALLTFAVVSLYFGLPHGLAILAGAVWGSVNLYFIKQLVKNWLIPGRRDFLKILVILGLKFPILYLAGFGLLMTTYLPELDLLIGFTLIMAVIFLKGLGRLLMESARSNQESKAA